MTAAPAPLGALALGGNQGTPLAAFRWALAALAEAGLPIVAVSSAYLSAAQRPPTAPAAGPAAAPYWNAVCLAHPDRDARALLAACQALEARAGRRRGGAAWGPRPLDIDILFWGEQVACGAELALPHPRLASRPFVLWPLAEVALDHPLPGGTSARALLLAHPDPLAGIGLVRRAWGAGRLDVCAPAPYTSGAAR